MGSSRFPSESMQFGILHFGPILCVVLGREYQDPLPPASWTWKLPWTQPACHGVRHLPGFLLGHIWPTLLCRWKLRYFVGKSFVSWDWDVFDMDSHETEQAAVYEKERRAGYSLVAVLFFPLEAPQVPTTCRYQQRADSKHPCKQGLGSLKRSFWWRCIPKQKHAQTFSGHL